jgi:hypothetical protein
MAIAFFHELILLMTQSWAAPTVTGRVPLIITCSPVRASETSKVSGPVWATVGLVMCPAAQLWTTISGLASHGWWPSLKAACICQNRGQVVMFQIPGNGGKLAWATSMTTR